MFKYDTLAHGEPIKTSDEQGNPLPVTWTCEFHRLSNDGPIAKLLVDFDENDTVTGAHLTKVDGLTATELVRFPWARWISAATHSVQAARRIYAGDGMMGTEARAAMDEIEESVEEAQRQRKRPGRGGHPREFYEALAWRYSKLVADGVKNPVQTITDELIGRGEHVSRNTVATWVKRARELELLPHVRSTKEE